MTKLQNLTYESFVEDVKGFMDAIGKIRYGNKKIVQHVKDFITDLKVGLRVSSKPLMLVRDGPKFKGSNLTFYH